MKIKVNKTANVAGLTNGGEYDYQKKVFITEENCYGYLLINDYGKWIIYNESFFEPNN
jgi:hypothetical protein